VPSPGLFGCLTRIVGEQIVPDGIEMPQRGMAPVLQIGRMSVPAEVEAEWNAWYNPTTPLSLALCLSALTMRKIRLVIAPLDPGHVGEALLNRIRMQG
jgi:hypothetical protein